MPRFAMLLVLVLAGCDVFEMSQPAEFGSGDMQGWRFASGKRPSRAEYAAMVAACQGGAVRAAVGAGGAAPLDACLADLGMKRAP
jgi:hypothetical protein